MDHACVLPDTYCFLRLPSEMLKLIEVKVNTVIEVGRFGSFPTDLLLGRPYFRTLELLERRDGETYSRLRDVPPAEIYAEHALEDAMGAETPPERSIEGATNGMPEHYDLLSHNDPATQKTNRLTVDDASRQALSQVEIEQLKQSAGGKEIIEKILANHAGLDEKTAFSKAKYMLRKQKKYVKRFTLLPMDLPTLMEFILEKDATRIMEMREESLGLITAWSHAHFSRVAIPESDESGPEARRGRWLVVDDTGGLVVAALAERMGILYPQRAAGKEAERDQDAMEDELPPSLPEARGPDGSLPPAENGDHAADLRPGKARMHHDFPIPAPSNTITVIHPAVQPNLSILRYFGYDTSNSSTSDQESRHPLHIHLKTLSWLQVLRPEEDQTYTEPDRVEEDVLSTWKSGKRGAYYRKRRRWERCKHIVDETRAGGFDGLVVSSHMDPVSILQHSIPLIRGGGHIVIFSPTIEGLLNVVDMYSKDRRAEYVQLLARGETPSADDFPLDPRFLLGVSVQTSRVREWQVLPGRTHPLMTGRGSAEGYVFTARKVIPIEGGVEARGIFATKKRKATTLEHGSETPSDADAKLGPV